MKFSGNVLELTKLTHDIFFIEWLIATCSYLLSDQMQLAHGAGNLQAYSEQRTYPAVEFALFCFHLKEVL